MSVTARNRAEEFLGKSTPKSVPSLLDARSDLFLRQHGIECRGLAALGVDFVRELRAAPDELFQAPDLKWCKANGGNQVARVLIEQLGDVACFWKRMECDNFWDALRHRFFRSRARHAWVTGHQLLQLDIRTPRPMAYVLNKQLFPMREFLLTEAIPDSVTLKAFLITILPNLDDRAQRVWRLGFLKHLAEQLRKLHAARFDHRDLKSSNILVSCNQQPDQIWLLDLDDVRRWPWLPPQRVVQNLARLNVSGLVFGQITLAEQLRFLKSYLGQTSREAWKSLWKQVAHKTKVKFRQNLKRGRPLH